MLLTLIAGALIAGFLLKRKNGLKKLQPGTLILISQGYSTDQPSRGKILAIDVIHGQKIYGIQIEPVGEPKYTQDTEGKKINISSVGHLPISEQTLKKWQFKIIGQEAVRENELQGYRMWQESKGGAF